MTTVAPSVASAASRRALLGKSARCAVPILRVAGQVLTIRTGVAGRQEMVGAGNESIVVELRSLSRMGEIRASYLTQQTTTDFQRLAMSSQLNCLLPRRICYMVSQSDRKS